MELNLEAASGSCRVIGGHITLFIHTSPYFGSETVTHCYSSLRYPVDRGMNSARTTYVYVGPEGLGGLQKGSIVKERSSAAKMVQIEGTIDWAMSSESNRLEDRDVIKLVILMKLVCEKGSEVISLYVHATAPRAGRSITQPCSEKSLTTALWLS